MVHRGCWLALPRRIGMASRFQAPRHPSQDRSVYSARVVRIFDDLPILRRAIRYHHRESGTRVARCLAHGTRRRCHRSGGWGSTRHGRDHTSSARGPGEYPPMTEASISRKEKDLLESLQREAFTYFLRETNPANGLVVDKTKEGWPASIAAVGLGLACYPVGIERGFV